MKKAFLEDLAPGQVFTSEARAVVDAGSIKRFAGEFDPQPFHLDETSARPTFFKKLVASGWHTTAVTMQLLVQTLPLSEGVIGSGRVCTRSCIVTAGVCHPLATSFLKNVGRAVASSRWNGCGSNSPANLLIDRASTTARASDVNTCPGARSSR